MQTTSNYQKSEKSMFVKRGSTMYREYLDEFPESIIARDVKTWGRISDHGGFGNALYDGKYEKAWSKADIGNKEKMMKLGFDTKYKDCE